MKLQSLTLTLVLICSCVVNVSIAQSAETKVESADILVFVKRMTSDLELVRRALNKPEKTEVRFKVRSAEPRHVYFHTQTIFRKMNQLARDVASVERLVPTPAPEEDEIQSSDVLGLLKQAQAQLELVKLELGITDIVAQQPRKRSVNDDELMQALVVASQRTSQLLDESFEPKDVYRQLSLSSNYVAGVLAKYEGEVPFPKAPELDPNAQPFEVLLAIRECMQWNRKIGRKARIPVLSIDADTLSEKATEQAMSDDEQAQFQEQLRNASLSLNFEAATLLLADIGYWTWKLGGNDIEPSLNTPKEITTSAVLQKASQLSAQLQALYRRL